MTEQTFGSKAQVWHGTAKKTSGGLTKSDLMKNKHGRIVSRRKHTLGKKSIKHLRKLGYIAKKGKFTLFHKGHKSRKMRGGTGSPMGSGMQLGAPLDRALVASGGRRRSGKMRGGTGSPMGSGTQLGAPLDRALVASGGRRRSRKMRGGMAYGGLLSPQAYNGEGIGTSGVALQLIAGNAG